MAITTEQLMQEVRRLQITTRHAVTEVFAGEYSSAFKGRGMEFAEVREYSPGDDIRSIDWNVTARAGHPFVKRFTEERELTVMLAVDLSASGKFGSTDRLKQQLATEVSAVLAFAAIRKNDRVGLLIFTDRVEMYIPPRKGSRHTLRLVRELLAFEPRHPATSIRAASDHLAHVLKRRSVVFVVSDFLTQDYDQPLRLLSGRHDVIAVEVSDPRELELPAVGLVEFQDAETGERMVIDAGSGAVRRRYAALAEGRRQEFVAAVRRAGVDLVRLSTGSPYIHELMQFFKARERRR